MMVVSLRRTRRSRHVLLDVATGSVLLVVAAILAACTATGSPGSVTAAAPSPDPAASPSESVSAAPAGLEVFYDQTLIWTRCGDYVVQDYQRVGYEDPMRQCARFSVPLSYEEPADGAVLSLAVMRRVATDPAARIGPAILTHGANGLGLDLVANATSLGASDLNKSFDLVGFDQRGMGATEPHITCRSVGELDAMRATDVRTRTDAEIDAANAEAATFATACAANTTPPPGVDIQTYLAHVGTREAAMDLDILRSALGVDQLSLIGQSYGTRLAGAYTRQFPDRVRALVLDGIFPSGSDQVADAHLRFAAVQKAFEAYTLWCDDYSSCPLGADPAVAATAFQELVRPLRTTPLTLQDGRTLGYDDAITAMFVGLSEETQWSPLSGALLSLQRGFGQQLKELADIYWGRYGGEYWANGEASTAIGCVDGPAPVAGAQAEAIAVDAVRTLPFLDNGDPPRAVRYECDSWPSETTLDLSGAAPPALPPTLVISTVGDTATPHSFGLELAQAWGVPVLTVDGNRHLGYLREINCVNDAATEFLITLQPPAADIRCP